MRRGKLVLALVFWLCLFIPPAWAEGVNRALLIGCDRFVTQEDTAPSSANNVSQMSVALMGGAMNLDRIVTRRQGIAGMDELVELITYAFGEAEAGDVSYFYISTHGLWNQSMDNGAMTLVLSDGTHEEGVTARQLRQLFDQVPGTKVLILDACHAGAMIGKGVYSSFTNVFQGADYKVICSSGGTEESWFWSSSGQDALSSGAGYFSGTLSAGISSRGGFAADENADGSITLTELKRYLRMNHGASTVQTYPEEDDFAILSYDAQDFSNRRRGNAIDNVVFEDSVLSADQPEIGFSFTVLQDVRVAYQLVYQQDGRWDFAGATLIWDNTERYGIYGDATGWLSPGYKERSITLTVDETDLSGYGYVLLQVLTVQQNQPTLVSSRVLCIPPVQADPELSVTSESSFCPEIGDELTMIVQHTVPCELTVTITTTDGHLVRRLLSRAGTRPEQLNPRGTTVIWNGLDQQGHPAEQGEYLIHIKAYIGEGYYEYTSPPILLLTPAG